MNKYCRICWNTGSWRGPTGEAAKLETGDSYVKQHGFGQEEWLFNFSWLQPGPKGTSAKYRYSTLQPIAKYQDRYEKQTFDVFLYTVTPNKTRMAVAIIKDVYVPVPEELEKAYDYMRSHGWLTEMERNLSSIGISTKELRRGASHTINIRFSRAAVQFFEPGYILPKKHVTYRIDRYQPLNWIGAESSVIHKAKNSPSDGKIRSEEDVTRAAIEGTVYSPGHVKLQNALFKHLCKLYGRKSVHYERAHVDIELQMKGRSTLFEIKMALTAKSCIRQAIGQLLEYDIYPNRKRRSPLIVVGEESSTDEDETYLVFLRREHGIPIHYRRWNWELRRLEGSLSGLH